jgi:MinD-like ATPase involved in chromosome partitioning or flagellar assembly
MAEVDRLNVPLTAERRIEVSEPTQPPMTEPETARHPEAGDQELPAFANPWDPFRAPDQPANQNGAVEPVPPQDEPTIIYPAAAAEGAPPAAYPSGPVPTKPGYDSAHVNVAYPDRRPAVEPAYVTSVPPQAYGTAALPTQTPRPDQLLPRPEALLAPNLPDTRQEPAAWGWRGRLRKMTGGLIHLRPTAAELADRQAHLDIQRGFSKPMTVVVIQPKGGAGKTPTTIGIASALGVNRGGYILGWDDNETRGTLAVRVRNLYGQTTTAWDLLGGLPRFERADARVGDLSHFVRAQGEAQFDALASDDNPANMAQIGDEEFGRLHAVLQRFYRIIVIDTGNNVRSPNWQSAVNAADLVVVVSTYQRDVGYSGSWVLDHLGQTGRAALANRAVTVLTAADPKPDPTVRRELMSHFGTRTRAVVEIPYDPHIALGGPMEWAKMREPTLRAWTLTGAAVINALAASEGTIP